MRACASERTRVSAGLAGGGVGGERDEHLRGGDRPYYLLLDRTVCTVLHCTTALYCTLMCCTVQYYTTSILCCTIRTASIAEAASESRPPSASNCCRSEPSTPLEISAYAAACGFVDGVLVFVNAAVSPRVLHFVAACVPALCFGGVEVVLYSAKTPFRGRRNLRDGFAVWVWGIVVVRSRAGCGVASLASLACRAATSSAHRISVTSRCASRIVRCIWVFLMYGWLCVCVFGKPDWTSAAHRNLRDQPPHEAGHARAQHAGRALDQRA